MMNVISAFAFGIISFITWLAVSFKIASYFIDENSIFAKNIKAVFFYIVNGTIALIMTILNYVFICIIQKII